MTVRPMRCPILGLMRILVVDNYDSFVFNLVQYLGQLGVEATVWRNDDANLADRDAVAEEFDGILLSPGPGTPQRAGATMELVTAAAKSRTPLLGVHHTGTGVLAGLADPFTATRYHSLTVVDGTIPDELEVIGRTDSGLVMAMRHRELPIHGVQFHPESILTQGGHRMLANWLAVCGVESEDALIDELEAQVASAAGSPAPRGRHSRSVTS
jgi:para-aminobenzoate synthetase component 2